MSVTISVGSDQYNYKYSKCKNRHCKTCKYIFSKNSFCSACKHFLSDLAISGPGIASIYRYSDKWEQNKVKFKIKHKLV